VFSTGTASALQLFDIEPLGRGVFQSTTLGLRPEWTLISKSETWRY